MADRLITRDRTKEYLKRVIQQDIFKSKAWFRGETTIDAWVDAIPGYDTGDLVPVVRCKDCKHCDVSPYLGYFYCCAWGMDLNADEYPPDTFFCADGERRDKT